MERNPHHYLLKLSFDGHICGHTHRLAQATSEKTVCDICEGIKLHLSSTVDIPFSAIFDGGKLIDRFDTKLRSNLSKFSLSIVSNVASLRCCPSIFSPSKYWTILAISDKMIQALFLN